MRQAREWLEQTANQRVHRETRQRPVDRFQANALRPLPAIAGTLQYEFIDDRVHVRGLAVHPELRRRGVARRLVEYVAERGAGAGCRAVSLFTIRETGNAEIFQRLGFRIIRESEDSTAELVRGGRPTELYMERPLRTEGREGIPKELEV